LLLVGVFGLLVAGYTAIAATNHTISAARPFLFELPELLSEWASIRQCSPNSRLFEFEGAGTSHCLESGFDRNCADQFDPGDSDDSCAIRIILAPLFNGR